MATKRVFRCNDVREDTSGIFYENNAPYLSTSVEYDESFISEIFSVIGNRLVTFISKIIALNRRLLSPGHGVILRESLSINIQKRTVPDRAGSILKEYDSPAGTLHYLSDSSQETSKSGRNNSRDTNLSRVSGTEGYDGGIRKIKHSIIEDEEAGARYLMTNTSSRDLTLSRDFGNPYEIQRSLLIRSRLKNVVNSQDHPQPFSLLKHSGNDALESH